jgi:glycerol dehydrogenase-like iron-containing ADH family enzyme
VTELFVQLHNAGLCRAVYCMMQAVRQSTGNAATMSEAAAVVPITLAIEDLHVCKQSGGKDQPESDVLRGIHALFESGTVTAIMGASSPHTSGAHVLPPCSS